MKRIKQFGLLMALITGSLNVGFAMPIKPNLEKTLQQQEQRKRVFAPAQAGWNGPEMQRPQDVAPNPVLEAYGPAATARSIRASLVAAAIPDPKAVLAIATIIILMRVMRTVGERRAGGTKVVPILSVSSQKQKAA